MFIMGPDKEGFPWRISATCLKLQMHWTQLSALWPAGLQLNMHTGI